MATTYTENFHLGMQTDTSDKFDMSVITDNMPIIDTALAAAAATTEEIEQARGDTDSLGDRLEGIDAIIAAFPYMLTRGAATINSDSGFGFDDIHSTSYYRYTASAVGNPVASSYGIIITFVFTSYIVQILFSNTSATSCELRYRFSADTGTTWRAWHLVSATAQS